MALYTGYTPTLSLQPCGAQGLSLSQQGLGCLPLTAGVCGKCPLRSPDAPFPPRHDRSSEPGECPCRAVCISSRVIAAHLPAGEYHSAGSAPRPDDAAGVILRGLELGVTCLDTAADWGPFANECLIGARKRRRRWHGSLTKGRFLPNPSAPWHHATATMATLSSTFLGVKIFRFYALSYPASACCRRACPLRW